MQMHKCKKYTIIVNVNGTTIKYNRVGYSLRNDTLKIFQYSRECGCPVLMTKYDIKNLKSFEIF